jgi:hypothetical protein
VSRSSARAYVFAIAALFAAFAGCRKKAPAGPDDVFQRFELSIVKNDTGAFYDLLDKGTQKSIEGAWRAQQLQRTIIQSKYPEKEAGPALARLAAAAADDPRSYFIALDKERGVVPAYRKRLGSVSGPIKNKIEGPDSVWVARQDGMPFHFSKNRDGSWGWMELRGDWELEKDRAQHAVTTVQENAKLYQKDEAQKGEAQ